MSQISGFVELCYVSHLPGLFVIDLTGNFTAKWHLCAADM
jgi:hypothetical protein